MLLDFAQHQEQFTSLNMTPALIEGTETVVLFSIMLVFPEHIVAGSYLMSIGVIVNILQRLRWASGAAAALDCRRTSD